MITEILKAASRMFAAYSSPPSSPDFFSAAPQQEETGVDDVSEDDYRSHFFGAHGPCE